LFHRISTVAAGIVVVLAGQGSLLSQPVPKLNSISPEWIQRGTTVDVTLAGENLGSVVRSLFNGDAGLSATNAAAPAALEEPKVVVESTGGGITRATAPPKRDEKRLVLRVTAAPDASLSSRELRVLAPGGVSNPLLLNVGQWPEVAKQSGNVSVSEAPVVTLPAVISGVLNAAAQTNLYRFKANKGDELVFEVDAARRGSQLDSSLSVLDANGKELARNEDAIGLDSLLLFTAPADGEFLVAVRDFRFRGGNDYSYRLTAGTIPYVESIFPFGGPRGKAVEVAVRGRNLDGISKMTLDIAAKAPRSQEIRLKAPRGYSNLIPFNVSDLNEIAETEPNNESGQAQAVTIPLIVNGRVGVAGDVDRFKFKVDRDQKLAVDVAAGRFGSRLDALLILTDTNGAVLVQNDDAAGADARIEFDAKKDTEYLVLLRDLTDRGGDNFGYRLGIRPPSAGAGPGFSARFLADVTRVHREGTARIRCEVTRVGGFEGPVRFVCEDLPTGVFAEALAIPNSPQSGVLVIHATKEAPMGSFPIRVTASGVIGGKTVALPAEPLNGDRPARQGYLTVLEAVPFSLDVTTLGASVEQNQATTIEVFAERKEGFNGEIKIVAEGFNAGREPLSKSFTGGEGVIKAGESTGKISITPKMDSELGVRTITLRGESTMDGQPVVTYTAPIPVSVTQFPLVLSSTLPRLSLALLPPGSTSAAGEAETKIRVERRAGFAGEVELSLEGLPDGVRSELPKLPEGVGEVTLRLVATEQAKVGTNYSIRVVGKGVFNDKNYRARTGKVELTIAVPESVEVATNSVPVKPSAGSK
jgi:hypothetical protein